MEATAAEVESEREQLAKVSSQSTEKAIDDGFIACKDSSSSSAARGPSVILYDTVVKAVELDRLVWAKCIYFTKGGGRRPFFPARICDNSEGALLSPKEIGNEWPIPATKALVQFISLTKKPHNTYEHALLERDKDIIPFDKPLDSTKKQTSMLDFIVTKPKKNEGAASNKGEWNADNIDNMYEVLASKFTNTDAKYIKDQIMTVANSFLEKAIPTLPSIALCTDSPVRSPNKSSPKRSATKSKSKDDDDDCDIVALATKLNSNPIETLAAGDWIAYFHHVFREHTVYTRIKEVIPSDNTRPLILGNGELIAMTDSIRKCQPANNTGDEYIKDSGHYNELRHYKLKKSKAEDIVVLGTKLRLIADGLSDKEIANFTEKKVTKGKKNQASGTPTDSDSQVTSNSPLSPRKRRGSNSGSESQCSSQSRSKKSR